MCLKSLALFFFVTLNVVGQSSSNELIDFDKKSSLNYLNERRVISANLDSVINFGMFKMNLNMLWLINVKANFTNLVPDKSLSVSIKKRPWIKKWLQEHKEMRLYFWMNHETSIPELVGYSKQIIVYPELKLKEDLIDKEENTFIDFTDVDPSSFSGKYITGWIDTFKLDMVFPFLFKKNILLVYPHNLWGDPGFSTYISNFKLIKPISIDLLEKIHEHGKYLVVKKVGDKYEICGYTNRKI